MERDITCAIITINNNNYGNRLQNYATQSILNQRGYRTFTIKNMGMMNKRKNGFNYLLRCIYHLFKREDFKDGKKRDKNFAKFNQNIKFYNKEFNWFWWKKSDAFDYYFVGSDQVWNPNYRMSEFDLLEFTESINKISFAASIGIDAISQEQKKIMKKSLEKFKNISVREEKAKEILQNIIPNKKIEVLIDPTMMISKEEWTKLANNPGIQKKQKYILLYFLGEVSNKYYEIISKFALENNCKIINVFDKESEFYNAGPSEFLYLEKNAYLICTDSFHSSVFGILFNVPFIVFDRKENILGNMNSRLNTLLSKFHLEERKYQEFNAIENYLKYDYSNAELILKEERKKVDIFLDNVFEND